MVTAKKITAARAAITTDYFTDIETQSETGDYYADKNGNPDACPGKWVGRVARRLRLSAEATVDQLLLLLDGKDPVTTRRIAALMRKDRVAGHDVTLSAPKSVSTVWAVGSDEVRAIVQAAQDGAVADAIDYLERHIRLTRTSMMGRQVFDTVAGVYAIGFAHHTSRQTGAQARRNIPPDPQVHTHVVLPMAQRHDGQVVAIASDQLMNAQTRLDAVYLAGLAARLADAGFQLHRGTGRAKRFFEIAGIPQELLDTWSQRTKEIEGWRPEIEREFREEYGRDPSLRERKDRAARRRQRKGLALAPTRFWREVAKVHGVTAESIDALRGQHPDGSMPAPEAGSAQVTAELLHEEGLTKNDATFTTAALHRVAMLHAPGVTTVAATEQAIGKLIAQGEVTSVAPDRWTTKEMLAIERGVLAWRDQRRGLSPPPPPGRRQVWDALRTTQRERNFGLTGEQREAFRAMLRERWVPVRGEAGTGKGVALSAAAHVWRSQGRRIFALAVAGAVEQRLAADLGDGVQAMTLDGFIQRVHHGQVVLRDDDVIAIDEAGVVGSRRWGQFTEAVGTRATVVALGDAAQLSALNAGGIWPLLAGDGPRLQHIHRSTLSWEREAWQELRRGDASSALRHYATHGHVQVSANRAVAMQRAVAAWDTDGRHGLIITDASNRERYHANRAAQARRWAHGDLKPAHVIATTEHGPVALHDGDRVIFRRQWRLAGRPRIENGTTATVIAVDESQCTVTVRTNESTTRDLVVPVVDNEDALLDLHYAAHVYKAQGATVTRSYVVAGGWQTDREGLYVALSRSREGSMLFIDRESFDAKEDGPAIEAMAKRGARSRAKKSASHYLPLSPGAQPGRHRAPGRDRKAVLLTREPLLDRYRRRLQIREARKNAKSQRRVVTIRARLRYMERNPSLEHVARREGTQPWVVAAVETVTGYAYAQR